MLSQFSSLMKAPVEPPRRTFRYRVDVRIILAHSGHSFPHFIEHTGEEHPDAINRLEEIIQYDARENGFRCGNVYYPPTQIREVHFLRSSMDPV